MSPSTVVRTIAVLAIALAVALPAFHAVRGRGLELSHFGFPALQVILALSLLSRIPAARWLAVALWFFYGIISSLYATHPATVMGAAAMASAVTGVICLSSAVLLLTPLAGRYFIRKSRQKETASNLSPF